MKNVYSMDLQHLSTKNHNQQMFHQPAIASNRCIDRRTETDKQRWGSHLRMDETLHFTHLKSLQNVWVMLGISYHMKLKILMCTLFEDIHWFPPEILITRESYNVIGQDHCDIA